MSADSAGSSRRQLEGLRPDCASSRTASAPLANDSNATPRDSFQRGRSRTRTQASVITPRIPSEPSRSRSGLGPAPEPGQPAALPEAAGGDRPHRLDQVVDVGVEGREVPAGAGRDPAAQGGELERLREMAKRQPLLAELVLERRPAWRRPGSAPPARRRPPRARGRGDAGRSSPPPGRRRRFAARRPRPRWSRLRRESPPGAPPRTRRAPPRPRARRPGWATRSGGSSIWPRKPRTTSR